MKNNFGGRLKSARRNKGISQTELANRVGIVSRVVISDLERGRTKRVDTVMVLKISKELGVEVDWLFLGNDETVVHKSE